ncbi:MAG: protein TolQ [Holosporaceae bacterium]|jgi:biopolymer transport protein TolQ|nr:protein TolQ [Holosporaceae bacterium]
MNGAEEVITATSVAYGHDLSILGLFAQASFTVKVVIILLLASSLWSWSITFAKLSLMKKLKASGDKFEDSFWNSGSMDMLYDSMGNKDDDPFVSVFIAGMKELRRTKTKIKSAIGGISLKDRIDRMMRVTVGREIDYLERHLGFLATVGSTAPFIGLFGTVWGIMNSFESIGFEQNTSLTSVAPGIAEALFATALGLVVTIPAVIAYNKISSEINRYQNRLEAFVDEFSAIISRQIEDTEV